MSSPGSAQYRQMALAGLQELLRPSVIKALGNTFAAAKLSDAGLAAQAVQNDADLLFGRMAFAGDPADVLYEPLRRRFSRARISVSSPLLDGYDEPEILRSSSH